ncbi:hypothetical protein Peur_010859 [Populus x canadensis]
MLVAAIMDTVTSNCDSLEKVSFKPPLPGNAEMRDIAAAIEVVEEGGLQMDNAGENEDDDDGGRGMEGIGIKILEGTTVLGLSRTSGLVELEHSDAVHVESFGHTPKTVALLHKHDHSFAKEKMSSAVVSGLWDDLRCQHVAVPFAAWALANWALASEVNRYHIQELDQDGQAVMTALMAPERSVRWHGSLVAQLLLEDRNLPLNDSVSDWSFSLLATISQASKNDDIPLAQMALSALLLSVERSPEARKILIEKGLLLMRDTAKRTTNHKQVQEALAKALELLSTSDVHLSLEDSQKWSGILLSWVFAKFSSTAMRSSSIKILSCIFEEHGPSTLPISQGWLAILLNEVLVSSKVSFGKGGTQPKADKTQIDQSNIAFATQTANQLAGAAVDLARNQLGTDIDSVDSFPLADLLSMDPSIGPLKNMKKDSAAKFNVEDSALATLKGIKALTELCSEDSLCQDKIYEFGVVPEPQEQSANTAGESSNADDKAWCKWLEDCAYGRIAGCHDLKTQSYARATLSNVLCNHYTGNSDGSETEARNRKGDCARYGDMIFLVNTDLPHWKRCEKIDVMMIQKNKFSSTEDSVNSISIGNSDLDDCTRSSGCKEFPKDSNSEVPEIDVVFVHGLRGGPYKMWHIAEDKHSIKSGLVEKIDEEAGKQVLHSGPELACLEDSSKQLEQLVDAGIGNHPVVFVTHRDEALGPDRMQHTDVQFVL